MTATSHHVTRKTVRTTERGKHKRSSQCVASRKIVGTFSGGEQVCHSIVSPATVAPMPVTGFVQAEGLGGTVCLIPFGEGCRLLLIALYDEVVQNRQTQ